MAHLGSPNNPETQKNYMRDYRKREKVAAKKGVAIAELSPLKRKRKEGGRAKDEVIVDGFNTDKLNDPLTRPERKELTAVLPKAATRRRDLEEIDVLDEEDTRALADLRYAYRFSEGPTGKRGKLRLEEMMKDDQVFKFAVKELIRMETAVIIAKSRKVETGAQIGAQNFFVVLKGLEEEKKFLTKAGKGDLDMKQISRAMNPDENSYSADEIASKNEAPEMLLGRDNNEGPVEDWLDG